MTPEKQRYYFRVALLGGEPPMFAGYLGSVEAADEEAPIEAAAREFDIGEALRARCPAGRVTAMLRDRVTLIVIAVEAIIVAGLVAVFSLL